MTDKELTELAARAVGITITYNSIGTQDARCPWKPLEDDGDALRLAVKLNVTIDRSETDSAAYCYCDYREQEVSVVEPHGDDPYAATRRAIVRAAAEIGKESE